jgi:hypothetical protein
MMSLTARAQDVTGGVVLGANVATLNASGDGDLGYRTAASGGLFIELGVGGPFSARSELLFSQKGAKVDTPNGELTLKANYLELPVLAVGQLPFARSYSPHLVAGPALSLKLYERQGAPGFSVNTDETVFQRTDVGIMVGAGASLGGPGALQVEVRYIVGLRDVTQPVTTDPLDELVPADGSHGVWSFVARFGI